MARVASVKIVMSAFEAEDGNSLMTLAKMLAVLVFVVVVIVAGVVVAAVGSSPITTSLWKENEYALHEQCYLLKAVEVYNSIYQ